MTRITVVDDSKVDRMLIAGLLKSNREFDIEVAESPLDAFQQFVDAPPDLVVTDLIMPDMDGFEFVKKMRVLFPGVPVILMTAYGNATIAMRALKAGAASYVPKARQAECLMETVLSVLARAKVNEQCDELVESMDGLYYEFTLENDPSLIGPLVDEMQRRVASICMTDPTERVRAMIALEEALLSAMIQGNLEITESELAAADHDPIAGRKASLIAERRGTPLLGDRRIYLEARLTTEGAWFKVRNDGCIFEHPPASPSHNGDCFESGLGRGSMLMCSLMDKVVYNDMGNEVILAKRAR